MKIMEKNIQKDSMFIHDKILSELSVVLKKFQISSKLSKSGYQNVIYVLKVRAKNTQDNIEEQGEDIRYQNTHNYSL